MYRCYPASDDGNASCRVGGTIVRDGYDRLTVEWRMNDSVVVGRFDTVLTGMVGDAFDHMVPIEAGLNLYSVDVTVSGSAGTRVVLHADSMVCGDVIAIDGQSNSIWGFSPLVPHATARTFGSNFQATASAPGVLPLMSVEVRSLVHGPSGDSPVMTLLDPPPLA